MKITSAEFIKSAFQRDHWIKDKRPEIAFLGRSNVGKSSLINSLLGRKALARISGTPGRTQCINFFLINDRFYLVDLPGYGYAKVSKEMRKDWGTMARDYLDEREQLALCIQLIDARHDPTELDLQLNDWLNANDKEHIAVATKSDKLSRNELRLNLERSKNELDGLEIFPHSAKSGAGRDAIWTRIQNSIEKWRI